MLVVNEVEAAAVREAAQRILKGSSLSAIVLDFNERGVLTTQGVKWRPGTLPKVLRAGRLAGL